MKLYVYVQHDDRALVRRLFSVLERFSIEGIELDAFSAFNDKAPAAILIQDLQDRPRRLVEHLRSRAHLMNVPVVVQRSIVDDATPPFGPHTSLSAHQDPWALARVLSSRIPLELRRAADKHAREAAAAERAQKLDGVLRAVERALNDALSTSDAELARVGDSFLARVTERGPTDGRLSVSVRWLDARATRFSLTCDGALPVVSPRDDAVELSPQRGPWSNFLSLIGREAVLGDARIDDALLIRAQARGVELLNDVRAPLRLLAPHIEALVQSAELFAAELDDVPRHALRDALEAIITIYRVAFRARLEA